MITFDEAIHILGQHLGYDAKLAAKVLGSAMHSGSVQYGSQPIQTGENSIAIVTGAPPSSSSLVSHDDVLALIESRKTPKTDKQDEKTQPQWPWGKHSTPLLDKLAIAAEEWWSDFDPKNPSTAPTNAEVAKWLVGQGVAKRVAEVMAQILRADGLPPGPKK